jgi:hypothetical protein
MFVAVGCSNKRCPECTNSRVVKEVDYQIAKLKQWNRAFYVDSIHYGTVDLTLPKDLQLRVDDSNSDLLVAEAYASFAELRGGLSSNASAAHVKRDSDYLLAGWLNFQDWSSEEPLTGGYYPHVHTCWIDIRIDRTGIASRYSMYLTPLELKALKRIWTRRASALLGQWSYRGTFDLFVHYGDSYRDLRRRLLYQMRYASKDVARICRDGFYWHCITAKQAESYKKAGIDGIGFKKGRWWLRVELEISKIDKLEFLRLTERRKRKHVNPVGWINPRCLKKYEKLLGISYVRRSVLMKELSRLYCPAFARREGRLVVCGCELEYGNEFNFDYIGSVNGSFLVHEKRGIVVLKSSDDDSVVSR